MFAKVLVAAGVLVLCPALLPAQAMGSATEVSNTWDLGASLTVERAPGGGTYEYGWNGSVTERPYLTHPWIGGTIEGSGVYYTSSLPVVGVTSGSSLYTAMAGPIVSLRTRGAHPFAHALIGGVVTLNTVTSGGQMTYSRTDDYFGHMLGGGVDFPASRHVSVRAQADWFRIWQTATSSVDTLRLTGGLVYSF